MIKKQINNLSLFLTFMLISSNQIIGLASISDWQIEVAQAIKSSFICDDDDIVKFILQVKKNVNTFDKYSMTALMHVSKHNYAKTVKFLINAHVNVNLGNNNGNTALSLAVWNSNINIVKLLLVAGANIDSKARAQGLKATYRNEKDLKTDLKIVKMLQDEPSRRIQFLKKINNLFSNEIIKSSDKYNLILPVSKLIIDYASCEQYEDVALEDLFAEEANMLIPEPDASLFDREKFRIGFVFSKPGPYTL